MSCHHRGLIAGVLEQVLLAMPLRLDELRVSGVAATVKDRVPGHPNRAIKDAAAAVLARWEGRKAPPAPPAAPPPRPAQPPGAALPSFACACAAV